MQLKNEFERNNFDINNPQLGQNVWIMAAAVIPFNETLETSDFLPYNTKGSKNYDPETDDALRKEYRTHGIPTHIVRIVLRCSFDNGTQQYVDGTDVYVSVDVDRQKANLFWAETWVDGPPKFHGGTIPAAVTWVRQMAEPFYIQYRDPFLTPEQRIALNGYDDDYQVTEPTEYESNSYLNHSYEDWIQVLTNHTTYTITIGDDELVYQSRKLEKSNQTATPYAIIWNSSNATGKSPKESLLMRYNYGGTPYGLAQCAFRSLNCRITRHYSDKISNSAIVADKNVLPIPLQLTI